MATTFNIIERGQQSVKARTSQNIAKATGSARLMDGSLVDKKKKETIDASTRMLIDELGKRKDFIFTTVECYARPIAQIGVHNTNDDDQKPDNAAQNIKNAKKASMGYHHVLLVLTDSKAEQFICDRMQGVRFCRIGQKEAGELKRGHLKRVHKQQINLQYILFRTFMEFEIKQPYNAAANNCITFGYRFMTDLLGIDTWDSFNNFAKYIEHHFDAQDIMNGVYNKPQNEFNDLKYPQCIPNTDASDDSDDSEDSEDYEQKKECCVSSVTKLTSSFGEVEAQFEHNFREWADNGDIPGLNVKTVFSIYLWRATLIGAVKGHYSIVIGCDQGFFTLELYVDEKKEIIWPVSHYITKEKEKENKYIEGNKWEQPVTGEQIETILPTRIWRWEVETTINNLVAFTKALIQHHGRYSSVCNSCQDFAIRFIKECAAYCDADPPHIESTGKSMVIGTLGVIGAILGTLVPVLSPVGASMGKKMGRTAGRSSFNFSRNRTRNAKKERIIPTLNQTPAKYKIISDQYGTLVVKDFVSRHKANAFWNGLSCAISSCFYRKRKNTNVWEQTKKYGISNAIRRCDEYVRNLSLECISDDNNEWMIID